MPKCCGSCFNYHNVLYLLGFGWNHKPIENYGDLSDLTHPSITIEVKVSDIGITTNKVEEYNYNSKCRKIGNIIYNLIICCLIGWQLIYAAVKYFEDYEIITLKNCIFQTVFLSQYIIGSIYFSRNHFYIKMQHNKKMYKKYTIAVYIGLMISVAIVIVSAILLNIGYKISVYTTIINNVTISNKIMVVILHIIEKFFSTTSYITNMITFSMIMIYHREKITSYRDKIENDKANLLTDFFVSITDEFHAMRDEYKNTIENINGMFNMLSVFGLLSLYFGLINIYDKKIFVMDIVNMAFFIIVESIYVYSINKVRNSIDTIKTKMTSNSIIRQVMGKSPDRNIISKINITDHNSMMDMSYHNLATSFKNVEVLNWFVLKDVLSTEWETFNFLGFPITDSLIMQKMLSVFIGVILAKNLSDIFA